MKTTFATIDFKIFLCPKSDNEHQNVLRRSLFCLKKSLLKLRTISHTFMKRQWRMFENNRYVVLINTVRLSERRKKEEA